MPKISVIVPVYKVENYLPQCLKSISDQTFQDFELILVDDGSPDTCGAMCEEYAAEHPNTRVLHQSNMGLSEARNQGVLISTGEYITFIDSDDYVAPDYLEYLLHLAETFGADVAVGAKADFWDNELPAVPHKEITEKVYSPSEALSRICYARMGIFAWGKLYKRHLVEQYPYPKGQLYEDTATTYKIVGDANAVAAGDRCIYYWRQRVGSITHQSITERHYFGITAAQQQLKYMEERYPEVVPAAKARCAMKAVDFSYRLVMGGKDDALFRKAQDAVKPIVKDIRKDPKVGMSIKIRATALACGYWPYLFVSKLYTCVKGSANRHRKT